jgi:hypothetical protein
MISIVVKCRSVILADFGYLVNNWPECSQLSPLHQLHFARKCAVVNEMSLYVSMYM